MIITQLYREFFKSEKSGGLLLILCTIISLVIANTNLQAAYINFWHFGVGEMRLEQWINEGLMAVFFLLIGLELEREIYVGELSEIRNAILPVSAAIGGMVVPAAIFLLFNFGKVTQAGAGIPTATDIAFSLGILSLLGKKVPISLKIFLTALAVVDDLGAIMIIALFYTGTLIWTNLLVSMLIFLGLLVIKRFKVNNLIPYILGGIAMWYFMLHSGVHPTVTGVLLAFAIPFGTGDKSSPSYRLQHLLHKPVAFLVLPLFALANTAIIIGSDWQDAFTEPYGLGVAAGLIIGKPLGIILFSFAAVLVGLCSLPGELHWKHIVGTGFLAGIGFTMSIFITLLAFDDPVIVNNTKAVILGASVIAGLIGFLILKRTLKIDQEQ
jgi:NhaA family Na+:H+ antiporter